MLSNFIHLQTQSEFSINNSIIRIKQLIATAKNLKMPAIALTDNNNLFAAIKFYAEAIKQNIKPILGSSLTLEGGFQIILLCQNKQGYLNLSTLISKAYQKENGIFISEQELIEFNNGLLLISSTHSPIAKFLLKNKINQAKEKLNFLNNIFKDRHYLGIARTLRTDEETYLHVAIALGLKTNTPVVALNDVQFLKKNDFETHEARVCIANGGLVEDDKRVRLYSDNQYLKSSKEMLELFDDLPETILNSYEIAKRCNLHFSLDNNNYLPIFSTPKNLTTTEFFTQESKFGLDKIIQKYKVDKKKYYKRLEFEIATIVELNFTGYFLIVADFIRWSKKNDIPVGPGRGSGAGSLVAYALGITNVDPLKYDLLFERFLNPERVSMPDFDIDFSPHGRDKVIDYVANKYGQEKVSQIITFGTMAAKGVIRDVGRVLAQGYNFTDQLAKLIPNDLNITIDRALDYEGYLREKAETDKKDFAKIKIGKEQDIINSKELNNRYNKEESVSLLINLAKKLEGLTRNAGTHAGGVIIAPSKISDFCPTYKAEGIDETIVSQFDKNDVETIGLVKFDFLGLSNLLVIQNTIKIIKKNKLADKKIIIDDIDLNDDKVYQLYRNADTTGVFQMESHGMREYLKNLKPTQLGDIVAMNALYRPGAMDYVNDYIAVKHGHDIKFPHTILKDILTPTNGVFVYQEQVMRAAQKMAGFSLGNADLLRRAMGKKKPEEMAKQRQAFVSGAKKINNIDEKKANEVFNYIDKFSGYGFNKSHSVAYALISYQTAWLKTHYRPAFMSAVISSVMGDTDRVAFMIEELKNTDIQIIPPCVNHSEYNFSLDKNKNIIFGLGAIKGIGENFIEKIVACRNNGYQNLFDFCQKIEKKYLNKRAIEALIHSGSFICFGQNKATLLASYAKAVHQAEIKQRDLASGQFSLFDNLKNYDNNQVIENYIIAQKESFRYELELEKTVLGFYFSAHPTDEYLNDLKLINANLPKNITLRGAKNIRVVAMIENVFYKETKKGQMATVLLTDSIKKIEIMLFNQSLIEFGSQLEIGSIVVANCSIMPNNNTNEKYKNFLRINANEIENIEIVKSKYAKYFAISLQQIHIKKFNNLKQLLLENKGNCPVVLHYLIEDIIGSTTLDKKYNILATNSLQQKINNLLQAKVSKIIY